MFHIKKRITEGPLLSVIIPSYNHAKYIGKAVDSVLNQTYNNLELIVIDDGSQDNTLEVLDKYNDSRLSITVQGNRGAHCAINEGLQKANGEFLAILNSDDVYIKNRFENMISQMQMSPDIGFMCSYIQVIDSKGKKLGIKEGWRNMPSWEAAHPELSFGRLDNFNNNLLMTNFTSTTSNFLFTRKVYEKIGGMRNLRFAHDWDFALRAAEITNCTLIESPLLQYRIHESNTISTDRKWMLFEIAWIWAANLERFYNSIIFPDNSDAFNLIQLAESINLQGNDKIFWIIKTYIDAKRRQGIEHPEEDFLNNDNLRKQLLQYIVE